MIKIQYKSGKLIELEEAVGDRISMLDLRDVIMGMCVEIEMTMYQIIVVKYITYGMVKDIP